MKEIMLLQDKDIEIFKIRRYTHQLLMSRKRVNNAIDWPLMNNSLLTALVHYSAQIGVAGCDSLRVRSDVGTVY